MAISFKKYVKIISSVGGADALGERQLIGRLLTTNELLPTGTFKDFNSDAEVGAYFGTESEEYARAKFYFSWISKSGNSPQRISYARWVDVDVPAEIFGFPVTTSLINFQSISDGAFNLTLGSTTHLLSGLNFTGAGSFADVAGIIQTAINAELGAEWTGATVNYDPLRKSFNFRSGVAGGATTVSTAAPAPLQALVGTNLLPFIGWETGAIFSTSADAQTAVDAIAASSEASNNFGSFLFMPALTLDQIASVSEWNDLLNVAYMYDVPVPLAEAALYSAVLEGFSGTAMVLQGAPGEYHEMAPMIIEAATVYSQVNAVQNYMFQVFNLTPTVTTSELSDLMDSLRINYYGQTQVNGQMIEFFQRGFLTGVPTTDPVDMGVYSDEQWLKSAIVTEIFNVFLAFTQVPANSSGAGLINVSLTATVIEKALLNGTISVGKTLTQNQKAFIASVTGNPNAWYQVQNQGYLLDVTIAPEVVDDITQYKVSYLLVYSKNDTVRKAEGRDILI